MKQPLQHLTRDVEELCAAWVGAMPGLGAIEGSVQAEVEQMSDEGLIRVTDSLARLRRDAEGLLARVAAEVSKRSSRDSGESDLARAQGFHSPVRLIAASTGASRTDAARLIAVGTATAERQSISGERLPSRHPHVAAALDSGTIGVDAASAITAMLDRVRMRADPVLADSIEAVLVDLAGRVPLELLMRAEYLEKAKLALDAAGIQIPFPHMQVFVEQTPAVDALAQPMQLRRAG